MKTLLRVNYLAWLLNIALIFAIAILYILHIMVLPIPFVGVISTGSMILSFPAMVAIVLGISMFRMILIYSIRNKLKDTENIFSSYFKYFFLYHWHIKKKKMNFIVQRGGKKKRRRK